jgi:hypothetical protein
MVLMDGVAGFIAEHARDAFKKVRIDCGDQVPVSIAY